MTSDETSTQALHKPQKASDVSLPAAWTQAHKTPAGDCGSASSGLSAEIPAARAQQPEGQRVIVNVDGYLPKTPGGSTAEQQRGVCRGRRCCCWTATMIVAMLVAIAVPLGVVLSSRGSGEGGYDDWWGWCGVPATNPAPAEDDLPGLCVDDLADVGLTTWSCHHVAPKTTSSTLRREQRDFLFATESPSLYYGCNVAPRNTSCAQTAAQEMQGWSLQCKVDCFLVDLSLQSWRPEAHASGNNSVPLVVSAAHGKLQEKLWTAPEHLVSACAARVDKEERGSIMDYVSFDVNTAAPSDMPASNVQNARFTTNVSYEFETGLFAQPAETLALFEYADDRALSCQVRTGWETCGTWLGDDYEFYDLYYDS